MGCWKWFDKVLKDAGVKVTEQNEDIIHQYISEKARYGQCSPDWTKARKQIQANVEMRQELVERLRLLA